jgi:hypothetical protein
MNKDNYYPRPIQTTTEVDLDFLATFYKQLLELRTKKDFAEIEKLITLSDEDTGLRDVWTNPHSNGRQFFTLTITGVFRCWGRPCHYFPTMDHFDAGGTNSLLFEVKGDHYTINEWAKTHFVGKMVAWHPATGEGRNTIWMG